MAAESSRYPKVTAFLKWAFSFVATVDREVACILRLCGCDNEGDVCTLFATAKIFSQTMHSLDINSQIKFVFFVYFLLTFVYFGHLSRAAS